MNKHAVLKTVALVVIPAVALAATQADAVAAATGLPTDMAGLGAVGVLGATCWRLMVLLEKQSSTLGQIAKKRSNQEEEG